MRILLAGGAGYIGAHTALALTKAGHEVLVVDNYINSSEEPIRRVSELVGKQIPCYELDVRNEKDLVTLIKQESVEGIIHFAGLKAVGESVQKPLEYYRNNLDTTLSIIEAMKEANITKLIFSSSATVYGEGNLPPYTEDMKRGGCSNPYGWTKYMIEQILIDVSKAIDNLSVILLRYFNPIGAHESGRIGEDPTGVPTNLMPYITQVAVGKLKKLTIFGDDYETPDGTCLRDYIHVMDLAEGHVKAIEYLANHKINGTEIFNLGTGIPYSVKEIVETFEDTTNTHINHVFGQRRPGDLPVAYACADKARSVLGWTAKRNLRTMCRDSWNWQEKNPNGYRK